MTTPNTLKASLTADVGTAQVQIQRLIKTVEDMGKTVSATSATGQKAFKAEADEVARLVRELGASEKQLTQLSNARTNFNARIKSESMSAAAAARDMASAHGSAAKDVVKGLASIAAEAKITTGGLKDILSGVGSLAFAFGPTGAFVSAIAIGASAVVGFFTAARDETVKTQKEFSDRVESMRKSSNVEGLRNEAKRIFDELQPLQARLAQAQQNDFGGLTVGEGLRARRTLPAQIATLQTQFDAAREAALNPVSDIARSGMARVSVTADAPGRKQKDLRQQSAVGPAIDALGTIGTGSTALRDAMQSARDAVRPQGGEGVFEMIATDALKPVSAMQVLRAELEATKAAFKDMGATAQASLDNALGAGLDAVISGRGNVLQAMKRAAAEPIVAELRMNAIKDAGKAASYAASLNFAGAGIALASAAKNALGAVAVARIGGITGGGGDATGGAGGGGNSASFGRGASLPGDGLSSARNEKPMKIEMLIVQRTPDGRELARTRQQIQRLDDRNQPIRVTL